MSDFNNPWDDNSGRKKPGSNNNDDLDEIIRKGQEKIIDFLNTKKKPGGGSGGNNFIRSSLPFGKLAFMAAFVALLFWLSTGFYTIQTDEEGIVLRLGKYNRTSIPGLNYKLPSPIETVTKLSVTRINREVIGFRSANSQDPTSSFSLFNQYQTETSDENIQTVPEESQMLTGDENIVDINFDVQWKVKNAKDFLFNLRDITNENTVKSCAESAMREVIGIKKISDALAEERFQIEQRAKQLLQQMLDSYKMGVEIVRLQMLRVQPPTEVIDSYRDVQSAKADKGNLINKAYAYRNSIIPRARGEAQQFIQEAEGYKQQVVANAKGEASRFVSIYNEYQKAKDVTKKRMYLETMEQILSGMDKIIMDSKSSSATVPYLPLQDLMKNKANEKN